MRPLLLTAPSVCTESMIISLCWSANTGVSMFRSPLENITYEFVLTSSAVTNMFCSTWIVFKMGSKWPIFVECFFFFNTKQHASSFISRYSVKVRVVQPYNSTDTATVWKNSRFILSWRSDFYIVIKSWIAVPTILFMHILISLSVHSIIKGNFFERNKMFFSFSEFSKSVNSALFGTGHL